MPCRQKQIKKTHPTKVVSPGGRPSHSDLARLAQERLDPVHSRNDDLAKQLKRKLNLRLTRNVPLDLDVLNFKDPTPLLMMAGLPGCEED